MPTVVKSGSLTLSRRVMVIAFTVINDHSEISYSLNDPTVNDAFLVVGGKNAFFFRF